MRPTNDNADRLISALQVFGMGSHGFSSGDFNKRDNVVQLAIEPNRIDLMTSLTGVSFEDA